MFPGVPQGKRELPSALASSALMGWEFVIVAHEKGVKTEDEQPEV